MLQHEAGDVEQVRDVGDGRPFAVFLRRLSVLGPSLSTRWGPSAAAAPVVTIADPRAIDRIPVDSFFVIFGKQSLCVTDSVEEGWCADDSDPRQSVRGDLPESAAAVRPRIGMIGGGAITRCGRAARARRRA